MGGAGAAEVAAGQAESPRVPAASRLLSPAAALRRHWPEYLMEAAGIGLFMVSACGFGALLEHPASPVRMALPDAAVRRALMGAAMGLTAIGIIYSPWGKQSGAHINPAVTLAFLRLGKVAPADAAFYALAQFLGGAAGVWLVVAALGRWVSDPPVSYVATLPGPAGPWAAFAAEVLITFILMSVILRVSNAPRWARWTGLCAGVLVAAYITVEAPVSGMSMNPARSFASAQAGRLWGHLWIYFTAPPLGMLIAAELYRLARRPAACAKLHHQNDRRCIHCGANGGWG